MSSIARTEFEQKEWEYKEREQTPPAKPPGPWYPPFEFWYGKWDRTTPLPKEKPGRLHASKVKAISTHPRISKLKAKRLPLYSIPARALTESELSHMLRVIEVSGFSMSTGEWDSKRQRFKRYYVDLCDIVEIRRAFQRISLKNCCETDADIKRLHASDASTITELSFCGNRTTRLAVQRLLKACKNLKALTIHKVPFSDTFLKPSPWHRVDWAEEHHENIHEKNIMYQTIFALQMADALVKAKTIEELTLCDLNWVSMKLLEQISYHLPKLKFLSCEGCTVLPLEPETSAYIPGPHPVDTRKVTDAFYETLIGRIRKLFPELKTFIDPEGNRYDL